VKRSTLIPTCLVLCGALLAPVVSQAAAPVAVSCTRAGLQQAVNLYIAAQTTGDISGLPLANGLGSWENNAPVDIKTGLITKAMKIDQQKCLEAGATGYVSKPVDAELLFDMLTSTLAQGARHGV